MVDARELERAEIALACWRNAGGDQKKALELVRDYSGGRHTYRQLAAVIRHIADSPDAERLRNIVPAAS